MKAPEVFASVAVLSPITMIAVSWGAQSTPAFAI